MTFPLVAVPSTDRSGQHTALLSTLVELMYRAWQNSELLTVEQMVAQVLAQRPRMPEIEIQRAVARLESTGHIEMAEPDQWRRVEHPVLPQALTVCGQQGCLRPENHLGGHLPVLSADEESVTVRMVAQHGDVCAVWNSGEAVIRVYAQSWSWPTDRSPVGLVPVPYSVPFTSGAMAHLVRYWLHKVNDGIHETPMPRATQTAADGQGGEGQLVARHGDYVAVWRPGSETIEIYPDIVAWDDGEEPAAELPVPHGTPYSGAELVRLAEQWYTNIDQTGPR